MLAGAGLMIEKLGSEVSSSFIIGGASDGFKGDAAFGVELFDHGFADCGFVGARVADFLGRPVDVDLVGGYVKILGEADGDLVLVAVDQALDESIGGKALVLF